MPASSFSASSRPPEEENASPYGRGPHHVDGPSYGGSSPSRRPWLGFHRSMVRLAAERDPGCCLTLSLAG